MTHVDSSCVLCDDLPVVGIFSPQSPVVEMTHTIIRDDKMPTTLHNLENIRYGRNKSAGGCLAQDHGMRFALLTDNLL